MSLLALNEKVRTLVLPCIAFGAEVSSAARTQYERVAALARETADACRLAAAVLTFVFVRAVAVPPVHVPARLLVVWVPAFPTAAPSTTVSCSPFWRSLFDVTTVPS